ncbi:hypothetical protein K1719_019336 [Acacia pycnantha]|nr:hypothetical protein K1719_019336 [Acacia pycnantha]
MDPTVGITCSIGHSSKVPEIPAGLGFTESVQKSDENADCLGFGAAEGTGSDTAVQGDPRLGVNQDLTMESPMKLPARGYSYNVLELALLQKVVDSIHCVLRCRPGSQTQNHAKFNGLHGFVGGDFLQIVLR